MSEAYPSKYTLKTPIGDVEIDYDRTEIKKFVREIVQETEICHLTEISKYLVIIVY